MHNVEDKKKHPHGKVQHIRDQKLSFTKVQTIMAKN